MTHETPDILPPDANFYDYEPFIQHPEFQQSVNRGLFSALVRELYKKISDNPTDNQLAEKLEKTKPVYMDPAFFQELRGNLLRYTNQNIPVPQLRRDLKDSITLATNMQTQHPRILEYVHQRITEHSHTTYSMMGTPIHPTDNTPSYPFWLQKQKAMAESEIQQVVAETFDPGEQRSENTGFKAPGNKRRFRWIK